MKESKLEKVKKSLGPDTVQELEGANIDGLKNKVVQAEQAMLLARAELEANLKYQEMKEALKDLSQSMRDLNKRQKAIIQLALHLIEAKGE